MKRKVIQIADSTQLISLPRQWAKKNNIKKGDEINVDIEGSKIVVSAESSFIDSEKAEIDISDLSPMVARTIHALYKKGVDEIKVTFNTPELISQVQHAVRNETVGYEVIEEGKNYCTIKNVSGDLEEFDHVLRRIFLLMASMSDETLNALKKKDYKKLDNIKMLEEANNRFTTACRRYLNKNGHKDHKKVGPLYYIIEDLESLADQYKYLCEDIQKYSDEKSEIDKNVLGIFEEVGVLFRDFYELFYKFDNRKLAAIGDKRKGMVGEVYELFPKVRTKKDMILLHHSFVMLQKIFNYLGPTIILHI